MKELLHSVCLSHPSTDPIAIFRALAASPRVRLHGPEHHILVGAALLTACRNAGRDIFLPAALAEMERRGAQYPGGSCGSWGCCGAAVSCGMAVSILLGTTPLSREHWGLGNRITAGALQAIGDIGGPRCCKRNACTALRSAAVLLRTELGIALTLPEEITCTQHAHNAQCIALRCPYYPQGDE